MLPEQKVSSKWQLIYGQWGHVEALDGGLNLQWLETWVRGVDTGLADTKKPLHLWEGGSNRWFNARTYPISKKSDTWHPSADGKLSLSMGVSGTAHLKLA